MESLKYNYINFKNKPKNIPLPPTKTPLLFLLPSPQPNLNDFDSSSKLFFFVGFISFLSVLDSCGEYETCKLPLFVVFRHFFMFLTGFWPHG